MKPKTKSQLEDSYNHIKNYLDNEDSTKELREMCNICECYYGKDHNYDDCKDKPCFKFWLAYEYLEWDNAW